MSELIGQRIKDYEILESIGEGGMGAVYRARQLSVERDVVVKVIREQYARNEDFIRNFEYEASIIANLESPYIVPLYDFWRESGGAYMIMRYMRGGSVRDELKESWDSSNVAELLNLVARALMTAHGRGVVHRDIKPDNILLDDNGEAFLADFGLASDTRLGVEGRGYTPAYAAPEQIRREQVTPQTDIYSLGIVLYELLTGSRPFTDSTISDLESRHINEPLPAVTETRPDVPHEVDDVISKATDKDPLNRYTTSLQLSEAFARALRGEVGSAPSVQVEATVFNPYKGLEPFDYGDRHNFFGRDALTTRLVNRLRNTRFLAVVGPSGSGKSSVVKAGVIPSLKQGDITNSNRWYIGSMTPGNNAFANLAQELRGVLNDPPPGLENQLRADETALGTLVKNLLPGDESAELLLFIDQFEEMFTLNGDDRTVFLNNLYHAVNDPDARLRVVITLRADFYDRPLQVPNFGELVRENLETVVAPNRSELEEAIVRPSERVAVTLEPDLVNQIINDVGDQPGMLPLLQYALRELFNQATTRTLTLRNYRDIGGVAGALARNAEELYTGLNAEQQISARDLFLSLVSVNEDMEATRRRILRTDLSRDDNTQMVLDHFGAARLLTFDNDPETRVPTVEIAHEALIRTWDTLRDWIDNNRDALRIQRQLQTDTRIWRENGLADDFLAQAGPLSLYRDLMEADVLPISPEEKTFIDTSIRKREEEQLARTRELEERLRLSEESERQKEQLLEQEQAATERQRQNLQRLQILVGVAALLFVIALVFAIVAFFQGQLAQNNAADAIAQGQLAQDNAATAEANANSAATNAAIAETSAAEAALANQVALTEGARAIANEAAAEANADEAATNAAIAQANAVEAATNAAEANANAALAEQQQSTAEALAVVAAEERDNVVTQESIALTSAADAQAQQQTAEALAIVAAEERDNAAMQESIALTSAALADQQRQTAEAEGTRAADLNAVALTEGANAVNNAATAEANAATAVIAQEAAAGNAATADANAATAVVAQEGSLSRSLAGQAELLLNSGDYTLAAILALEANRIPGAPIDVQRVLSLAAYNGPRDIIEPGQLDRSVTAATNCGGNTFVTGDADGTIRYWFASSGGLSTNGSFTGDGVHSATITALACSPDGSTIVSGDRYGDIVVWSVGRSALSAYKSLRLNELEEGDTDESPTPISGNPDEFSVLSLSFYSNDPRDEANARYIVAGYRGVNENADGRLLFWDTEVDEPEPIEIIGHSDAVSGAIFLENGTRLVSTSVNGEVILWDTSNLIAAGEFDILRREQYPVEITQLILSPDGSRFATAGVDAVIVEWDASTLQILGRMVGHNGRINSIDYALALNDEGDDDNETLIVSAADDRNLILWDVVSYRELQRYRAHSQPVTGVAFSDDAEFIVSTSLDRYVMLWDRRGGAELDRRSVEDVAVQRGIDVQNSAFDNRPYAVTTSGASIYLWEVVSNNLAARGEFMPAGENRHQANISAIAISPDGAFVATGDEDGFVVLWSTATQTSINRWQAHDSSVEIITFSENSQLIATGSEDRLIRLWNVGNTAQTGEVNLLEIDDLAGNIGSIQALTFCCEADDGELATDAPQRQLIASGSSAGELFIWNWSTGEFRALIIENNPNPAAITSLRFSPDGTFLVAGQADNTLALWRYDEDEATYLFQRLLRQHTAPVRSVDFNPDGNLIISASDDRSVIVWNVQESDNEELPVEAAPIRSLIGHTAVVNSVRFVNNNRAISSGDDGRIILWLVHNPDELDEWIEVNRDIPETDCDTLEEYGITECEPNAQGTVARPRAAPTDLPSLTPTFTTTPTPDFTLMPPTLTITPTPSMTPDSANAQSSNDYYNLVDREAGIANSYGYEAERRDLDIIDLSFSTNTVRWSQFDNVYGNFMFRTTIDWAVGSLQDRCGVIVRMVDRDNFHMIQVDQLGNVYYIEQRDDEWLGESEVFTNPKFIQQLPIETSIGTTTTLTVIVDDDGTQIYIDDDFDLPIFEENRDEIEYRFQEGYIALAATVLSTSREAACVFRDTYVVDLDRSNAPPPTAIPPTPLSLTSFEDNTLQNADEIVPELWGNLELEDLVDLETDGTDYPGYISEQSARLFIDLTGFENVFRPAPIETGELYTDFIAGTYFTFQSNSAEDTCGLVFRWLNSETYYYVDVNPAGQVTFVRVDPIDSIRIEEPGIVALRPGQNQLIVVGVDVTERDDDGLALSVPESRFIIYLNGEFVGEIRDGSNLVGGVALMASIGDESDSAGCIFERSWVWNLDLASPPPRPTPLPTVAANDGENKLSFGQTVTSNLEIGGQEFWTFNTSEENVPVVIEVSALRPVNGADLAASNARQLLDVELRVVYIDENGNETFIDYSGDIVPGQETNVQLAVTLPYSGEYRFEVYSVDDATGGDYTISIEPGEAQ